MNTLAVRAALCAAVTLTWASQPALAQPTGNIRSVTYFTVKPDRIGDFQAAIKEYIAVFKKANWDHSGTMWRSQTGSAQYRLVAYSDKWAELDVTMDPKLKDVAADLTRIGARINQCLNHVERIIDEVVPEMTVRTNPGTPSKMVRVLRSRVRADMSDAYMNVMKSDLLPAVRKSGLKVFVFARTRYGAPQSEFHISSDMGSWSDLDSTSPIVKAMGEDGYKKFLAKVNPMVIESEWNVFRYEPDLSYIAPTK